MIEEPTLVLGGGITGIAWQAGVLAGWLENDVNMDKTDSESEAEVGNNI